MRLSAPRYLAIVREEIGEIAFLLLKEVFINGCLTRLELTRLLNIKHNIEPNVTASTINDLTLRHLLIGVATI